MKTITIPDLHIEIQDDADLVKLQQGDIEVATIMVHRVHLQHLATALKLFQEDEGGPQLSEALADIHEQAEALYCYLSNIISSNPDQVSEDVLMAKQLLRSANHALGLWG